MEMRTGVSCEIRLSRKLLLPPSLPHRTLLVNMFVKHTKDVEGEEDKWITIEALITHSYKKRIRKSSQRRRCFKVIAGNTEKRQAGEPEKKIENHPSLTAERNKLVIVE